MCYLMCSRCFTVGTLHFFHVVDGVAWFGVGMVLFWDCFCLGCVHATDVRAEGAALCVFDVGYCVCTHAVFLRICVNFIFLFHHLIWTWILGGVLRMLFDVVHVYTDMVSNAYQRMLFCD